MHALKNNCLFVYMCQINIYKYQFVYIFVCFWWRTTWFLKFAICPDLINSIGEIIKTVDRLRKISTNLIGWRSVNNKSLQICYEGMWSILIPLKVHRNVSAALCWLGTSATVLQCSETSMIRRVGYMTAVVFPHLFITLLFCRMF